MSQQLRLVKPRNDDLSLQTLEAYIVSVDKLGLCLQSV